jgi:hypothetical protein
MIDDSQKSVLFLEYHFDHSFKEIFNQLKIKNIEWQEYIGVRQMQTDIRALATFYDSNVIALFPPFKETDTYYLPQNSS